MVAVLLYKAVLVTTKGLLVLISRNSYCSMDDETSIIFDPGTPNTATLSVKPPLYLDWSRAEHDRTEAQVAAEVDVEADWTELIGTENKMS